MSATDKDLSTPTRHTPIKATDLPEKEDKLPEPEKFVPCNLRPPSLTWREFYMKYDTIYVPPQSSPVAKYNKPPIPNAPLSPEGHHYIMPCNSDELCARALRKRNDAKRMQDCISYTEDMRNDTAAIVVEQEGRMALLEQECKQAHMLFNMYTGLLIDLKHKKMD